jgi:hypothetical protein
MLAVHRSRALRLEGSLNLDSAVDQTAVAISLARRSTCSPLLLGCGKESYWYGFRSASKVDDI